MRRLAPLLLGALLGAAHAAPVLDGRTLRFESGDRVLWQRVYPASWGNLSAPLEVGGVVYQGAGPVVYALSAQRGTVLGRADLPGRVAGLDASGGLVLATTQEAGITERYTLEGGPGGLRVRERVVFPPDPAVTGYLARVADRTPGELLAQAARLDPGNAFVALRVAQDTRDPVEALREVRRALGADLPFPAWVTLAARLDRAGYPAAADVALSRAARDAAARGLDPDVPVGRAALLAYGNPSGYVGTLLAQGRLARAGAWMGYLRELHPRFEGSSALYARYAAVLDAQGRSGEADEWREFARSLRGGTLYGLGEGGLGAVRQAARLATLATLLAVLCGLLALSLRAWATQGEDTRAQGGRLRAWLRHPLARARRVALAYASPSERLVLALLGVALVAALGGWQWVNQASAALRAPALGTGTYGGGYYATRITDLPLRPVPDAALLSGLAAQLDGDDARARELYTRALPDPCAANNLGVIAQARGDEAGGRERYRAALAARPDLPAAAFNLGLNPADPGVAFQRAYRPGQPRLCYPDDRSITRAVTGDLSVTLGAALRDPLALLRPGPGQSPRVGAALLLGALGAALLVLALVLPRPALLPGRDRPALYRLLGLLVPGATLLDSPWGGVLLLVWAALVLQLLPLALPAGTALASLPWPTLLPAATRPALLLALALLYGVNTLFFVLAEVRRARRRARLGAAVAG